MEFHWYQAIPWILAAAGLLYGIFKDRTAAAKSTEDRLRALEVAGITDRLNHQHQLELMQNQVEDARAAVQEVRETINRALQHGN